MKPTSGDRVVQHTADHVNKRIRERMHRSVARAMRRGDGEIERRLRVLDREWDIERALEANAAAVILGSFVLGHRIDRRFLYVPLAVGGFLLMHALQGWCPPLPLLRRLGIRTASEIEEERQLLHAMRARLLSRPDGEGGGNKSADTVQDGGYSI